MVHAIFIHPDLGIGGAERLIVDAGLSLQEKGHRVTYFTNHHDPDHCFIETKDSTLSVRVVGDWLPRTIMGYFHALCAYIRMLYLVIYFVLAVVPVERPDVVICDQIPIGVPFLKICSRVRVIFYCHFPDLLLSEPGGFLKQIYRCPLNFLEEKCIKCAHEILVNSKFTRKVFRTTFTSIEVIPMILYPSINSTKFDKARIMDIKLPNSEYLFLSINRYERKKNLSLVIKAFAALEMTLAHNEFEKCHLVMMGGYDLNLPENVEHYEELVKLREFHGLQTKITFFKSPSDNTKVTLLKKSTCVIYTPENEHFGIVPLEAMYAGKPVIAVDSGGPKETIEHEVTGFLCQPAENSMAYYMAKIIESPDLCMAMGQAGLKRFKDKFSFEAFSKQLNSIVFNVTSEHND